MKGSKELGRIEVHDLEAAAEYQIGYLQNADEFHSELECLEDIVDDFFSSLCMTYTGFRTSWSWIEPDRCASVEYAFEVDGRSFKFVDSVECRMGAPLLSTLIRENLSRVLTQLGHRMNLYHVWAADVEPNPDDTVAIFHRFGADLEAQRLQGKIHYARIDDRVIHRAERRRGQRSRSFM